MLTLTLLQTADARLLMECNNTSTDFVCIAIQQHWKLFPSTADERPPKRLRCCACTVLYCTVLYIVECSVLYLPVPPSSCSIVVSPDDLSVFWGDSSRLVQRSLYNPLDSPSKCKTGRPRTGSAPHQIPPQKDSQFKPG